ncbi:hypothetical protein [Shewanella sp. MBTL60-007]|uniref:hypothetical protein n=1 Tax=Shewanella sp. MBTL60-007 TaxID=2815911 RepID=UPI001BB90D1A|nr:hypothetical protein [Shewanella sp. MBTL60-007]GIU28194.1 hypothetical protein TUM3792_36700 [Shewanella sp. MBTL60-007]
MRPISLLVLLFLSTGCTSDKDTQVSSLQVKPSKEETTAERVTGVVAEPSVKSSIKLEAGTFEQRGHSYQLNGEKYTTESARLVKGVAVFNSKMSEQGVLKGSFVVQCQQDIDFMKQSFSIESIALETYRLTPLETHADLYDLYQRLQGYEQLSLVEIEIDYSRHRNAELY